MHAPGLQILIRSRSAVVFERIIARERGFALLHTSNMHHHLNLDASPLNPDERYGLVRLITEFALTVTFSGTDAGIKRLDYIQEQLLANGFLSKPLDTSAWHEEEAVKLERCLKAMLAKSVASHTSHQAIYTDSS